MSFDFYTDEEDYSFSKYKFGDKIDNNRSRVSINRPQSINYSYLQDCETDYHFTQTCFDNRDIVAYFKFMKLLSTKSFKFLLDSKRPEWHLHQSKGCNLNDLIRRTIGKGKRLSVENTPTFFHFALYTSDEGANRTSGVKSPRIYFFLGDNATIYPIFYDPYHEINP